MLDKFEKDNEINERKKLHCVYCKRLTIHNLESRCKGSWSRCDGQVYGGEYYSILRCGACDTVCYETASWDSESYDYDEDNNMVLSRSYVQYPAPVSSHFTFNTESIPSDLDSILDEMLYALAGSKMVLATIGLRLAVEFIVNDKQCAGNNLFEKINDLRIKDLIDDDQKDLLHRIREKGNSGAHSAVGMSARELVAGMSIVEGLLEKLYNGPARHEETIRKAKNLLKEN